VATSRCGNPCSRALPTWSARDLDRHRNQHGFSLARDQRSITPAVRTPNRGQTAAVPMALTGMAARGRRNPMRERFPARQNAAGFRRSRRGEEGSQGAGSEGTDSQMAGFTGTQFGDFAGCKHTADSNTCGDFQFNGDVGSSNVPIHRVPRLLRCLDPSGDSSVASSMNSIAMSCVNRAPRAHRLPHRTRRERAQRRNFGCEFSPSQAEEAAASSHRKWSAARQDWACRTRFEA